MVAYIYRMNTPLVSLALGGAIMLGVDGSRSAGPAFAAPVVSGISTVTHARTSDPAPPTGIPAAADPACTPASEPPPTSRLVSRRDYPAIQTTLTVVESTVQPKVSGAKAFARLAYRPGAEDCGLNESLAYWSSGAPATISPTASRTPAPIRHGALRGTAPPLRSTSTYSPGFLRGAQTALHSVRTIPARGLSPARCQADRTSRAPRSRLSMLTAGSPRTISPPAGSDYWLPKRHVVHTPHCGRRCLPLRRVGMSIAGIRGLDLSPRGPGVPVPTPRPCLMLLASIPPDRDIGTDLN
jgi:hypothetical protein